ncbi:MAG: phosphotransferase [Ardenticatenaceae bacterium]|nr:phosphotransferase [Ardenticatenaceae bacterium]
MKQEIRERLNDAILQEARARYGLEAGQLEALDGFESFIYTFERDGERYILRLGHSQRRSEALIRGEVDWINYLAENGTSVAWAVPSPQGNLVEPIADGHGDHFLATAFVFAPGGRAAWPMGHDAAFCRNYGRLLGKMHRLASTYQPRDPGAKRPFWNDSANNIQLAHILPASDSEILAKSDALIAYFATLPTDPAHFGLIHQDAHGGNFHVDDSGTITLFDFDDCAYMWYANDVAMVLCYASMGWDDGQTFVNTFFPPFLAGYREEWEINGRWLAEIPHFMKLRELDLYAIINRDFTPVQIAEDGWLNRFMNGRRERLLQDVPFLDVDFTGF